MNTQEFEALAKEYEDLTVAELDGEFQKQLALAEKGIGSATRGSSFWNDLKPKIIAGIVRNRDVGSVTIGMITSEVLTKVTAAGVDLQHYRVVIAIFIAVVAKAVWDTLEERSKKSSSNP